MSCPTWAMRWASSIQIMSSGMSVFFIQNGYSPLSGKRKIMPRSSARWSRNMRPCVRVSSSAAISTVTGKLSGKTMRGVAGAGIDCVCVAVVAGCGGAVGCVQAKARSRMALLFILHLHHFVFLARDELVLFRVVAERAEGHAQQLRGLGLHAADALERLEHEDLGDRLEVVLERHAVLRELEGHVRNVAADEHVLG